MKKQNKKTSDPSIGSILVEEIQLFDSVIVTKDFPGLAIYKGYIGDVVDIPTKNSASVLVEFPGSLSEHQYSSFFLQKKDLIKVYTKPIVNFKTPLQWNATQFLITEDREEERNN